MATTLTEPQTQAAPTPLLPPTRRDDPTVYDRSSLPGDALVMIAGQTEADYLRLAPEGQFCEFLDGIVYMPPSVSFQHQDSTNLLLFLLQYYNIDHPIGVIATGPAAFRISAGRYLEPDLCILPEASRGQTQADGFGVPPALLIVEVLSPSNRSYDLETKATAYREAQVDEVWYVDRPNRVVVVDRRAPDGPGYTRESVAIGPVVAWSLSGFWFDVGWLWQDPPPNLLTCMATILAGPPGTP